MSSSQLKTPFAISLARVRMYFFIQLLAHLVKKVKSSEENS